MQSKIFLHKYRVSAQEMEAVGEPGDSPLVYEGVEIDSGKKMKVEVFPATSLGTATREKLEAEAMAARQLKHTNIPALSDFGVDGDTLVYVAEDFDGTSAEQWVTTCGPMPVSPVLRIASQVVSALGTAAFHGILHRAINPSNLVLVPGQTAQGEWPLVKVLHFVGVAPKFSATEVSAAVLKKSLPYVSPEQLHHGTVDFRSEMYSLGGTMWFLLTGATPPLPANGSTAAQSPTAALAAKKVSGMPKELQDLLGQMLSEDPEARPRDPLTFHKRLQDCLAQMERPEILLRKLAPSDSQSDATALKNQLVPLKVVALAALFLAMATLAAVVLRGHVWPSRVVRAKELISVPKRVAAAAAALPSGTPVRAKGADPMVWIATSPSPALADSNRTQSLPAENNANAQPPATGFVGYAITDKIAVLPAQRIWEPPANLRARPTEPVTTRNASPPPPAIDPWRVSATTQLELAPAPGKLRDGKTSPVDKQTAPKKNATPAVRRAEPAELNMKRAAPARSRERPSAVLPDTTVPLSPPMNSATPTEPTVLLNVPR